MNNLKPSFKSGVIPAEQAVTLVFDACALNNLARIKRENGRTWIDLIYETASLPSVERIIIPAVVADWELRGGVTRLDKYGKPVFHRIDHEFSDPLHEKGMADSVFEEFFSNVSQYRYYKGAFRAIPGNTSKIIVVESLPQYLMLDQIFALRHGGRRSNFRRNDAGEDAIEDIVRRAPISGPAYIITNDLAYLVNRNLNTTTLKGFPISTATDLEYVKAELDSREVYMAQEFSAGGYEHYSAQRMAKRYVHEYKAKFDDKEKYFTGMFVDRGGNLEALKALSKNVSRLKTLKQKQAEYIDSLPLIVRMPARKLCEIWHERARFDSFVERKSLMEREGDLTKGRYREYVNNITRIVSIWTWLTYFSENLDVRINAKKKYRYTQEGIYFTEGGGVARAEPLSDIIRRGVAISNGEDCKYDYPQPALISDDEYKHLYGLKTNMRYEKFRVLRELMHIRRYDIAEKIVEMEIYDMVQISEVVDRIVAYENGKETDSTEISLFEYALKEAVIDRADGFIRVVAEYASPSTIIKGARCQNKESLRVLAERVVCLSQDKPYWKNVNVVETLLRSYESGSPVPKDPDKLETLGTALGFINGTCEEFVRLCLASHDINIQQIIEARIEAGILKQGRSKIDYAVLTELAEEKKPEWTSMLTLKDEILKLAGLGDQHKIKSERFHVTRAH